MKGWARSSRGFIVLQQRYIAVTRRRRQRYR
jgi:hypothetical protein